MVRVSALNLSRFGIFGWWSVYDFVMHPRSDPWLQNFVLLNWSIWSTYIASCTIYALSDDDAYIFIVVGQSSELFLWHNINFLISNWWICPLKGDFLSIWKRCGQWSGWLYQCKYFPRPKLINVARAQIWFFLILTVRWQTHRAHENTLNSLPRGIFIHYDSYVIVYKN